MSEQSSVTLLAVGHSTYRTDVVLIVHCMW